MKKYTTLAEIPTLIRPISLSIGKFDGLHKGHQDILGHLKDKHGTSVVLTFMNPPSQVLTPTSPTPQLATTDEKVRYIEKLGVDVLILLPFSKDVAEMSFQMFLKEVHTALPFDHLLVGGKDTFGKDRAGTKEAMLAFAPSLHFIPHYIPKLKVDKREVSSSWIRECLQEGDLKKAEALLGRPVSFSSIDPGLIKAGRYSVRILPEGSDTFSEQEIEIKDDEGYDTEDPCTITFITRKD